MDVIKLLPGIKLKAIAASVGVVLVLLIGTGIASYHIGKANAHIEFVEKEVEVVVEREKKVIEYVEKRVPVIEYITRENIKYVHILKDTKEELNEAIEEAGSSPECSLTDREYGLFNQLIGEANSGVNMPTP